MPRPVSEVRLLEGSERFLKSRAYTIYSKWVNGDPSLGVGEYVRVLYRGELVGYGFYEKIGAVGLRLLAYVGEDPPEDLEELIAWRLEAALARRKMSRESEESGYRLVYADSDGMPGLVVDVYNDVAVVQSTSWGWDKHAELLARSLVEVTGCRRVYLKNDQRARKTFGMPIFSGFLMGEGPPETVIIEGSARFLVDLARGHKTGFYLDQREARLRLSRMKLDGMSVLDLFSYTGAFAIHALLAGASHAVMVEEDLDALEVMQRNLAMNGLEGRGMPLRARVERLLDSLVAKRRKFDVVIADPPAFIPSRAHRERGLMAYRRLYEGVLKVTERGGLVYASSCSYFLKRSELLEVLDEAASELGVQLRVIYEHAPINATPWTRLRDAELRYLKGFILQVE